MRPINLLPPEERRGEHAPARTGPLAYLLIGALCAILAGVSALVLTGNEIAEQKADLSRLEAEHASEQARADSLVAYTQFRAVRDQRLATVASLADSRFDWERVIRELSLVLPGDVWLTGLRASATPEAVVEGGVAVVGRESAAGPALEMIGCAPGHEAVARFVSVLRDIDGVTRVGVPSSALPGLSGSGAASGEGCQTRDFIAQFEIIVAFDAAPVTGAGAVPPPVIVPETTPTAAPVAGEGS